MPAVVRHESLWELAEKSLRVDGYTDIKFVQLTDRFLSIDQMTDIDFFDDLLSKIESPTHILVSGPAIVNSIVSLLLLERQDELTFLVYDNEMDSYKSCQYACDSTEE